jgi:hypothetical protein
VRDDALQCTIASICARLAALETGDRRRRDTGVIDDWGDNDTPAFSLRTSMGTAKWSRQPPTHVIRFRLPAAWSLSATRTRQIGARKNLSFPHSYFMGSSLGWCPLRRLRLFNFRPAQIKQSLHDDRNHWPFRASRIGCDICFDLSDKKCIR